VEWSALVDYWLDDGPGPSDQGLEEHLLGCEWCSGRLGELTALGEGVRRLAGEGRVEMVVTASFLERAAREGLRIREYSVPAGGRVDCTVTPEDDLLVGRLQCDFSGVTRLDLAWRVDDQGERRIEDVPFGAGVSELILSQAMPEMRLVEYATMRVRLLAREAESERILGEYTFAHYPTRG
jgi:hypothetical protein